MPITDIGPCKGATLGEDTTLCVTERPGLDALAFAHVAAPDKYGKGVYGRKFGLDIVLSSGQIARVTPGVEATVPDPTILHHFGVLDDIEPWERIIGDRIYTGTHPQVLGGYRGSVLTLEQKRYNYTLSSPRAIVENAIGLLKRYDRLYKKWPRSSSFAHQTQCVHFCCTLVNAWLRFHPIRKGQIWLRDRWEGMDRV